MKAYFDPEYKYDIVKRILISLQELYRKEKNGYYNNGLISNITFPDLVIFSEQYRRWDDYTLNTKQKFTLIRNIMRELEYLSSKATYPIIYMEKHGKRCAWFIRSFSGEKVIPFLNEEHQRTKLLYQWLVFKKDTTKIISKKGLYNELALKEFRKLRNFDYQMEKLEKQKLELTRKQYLKEVQDVLIEQTKDSNMVIEEIPPKTNTSKYRLQTIQLTFILE